MILELEGNEIEISDEVAECLWRQLKEWKDNRLEPVDEAMLAALEAQRRVYESSGWHTYENTGRPLEGYRDGVWSEIPKAMSITGFEQLRLKGDDDGNEAV